MSARRSQRIRRRRKPWSQAKAPGTGAKAKLTPADRILVTVLHLRKLATMDLLGQLLGVTAMTISRAKQEVRPLLEAHGHHINASTARLRTPTDVATFLAPDSSGTTIGCWLANGLKGGRALIRPARSLCELQHATRGNWHAVPDVPSGAVPGRRPEVR
ncbi:transposase family protein [Streptomyces diastatochromogenes]|nr:transposase family protein [Streptomyces diastatochromogenes]MCZ0985009.1 transposase family protein [Streptomyces diastatochromogenes]